MKSLTPSALVLVLVLLPSFSTLSLSNAEDFGFFNFIQQVLHASPNSKLSLSDDQDYDFFYFVQQWPGSYCDTKRSCCYPKTGKPAADFGIHGLWPNYNSGRYPSSCDPDNHYNASAVDDLMESMQENWPTLSCPSNDGTKFWTHEWEKHSTCAESILDQHAYFQAALDIKKKVNLLQALKDAGIEPDGGFYDLDAIKSAIQQGTGFTPGIQCNKDESSNSQLYQVFMCVNASGTELIECPVFPKYKCPESIEFPAF